MCEKFCTAYAFAVCCRMPPKTRSRKRAASRRYSDADESRPRVSKPNGAEKKREATRSQINGAMSEHIKQAVRAELARVGLLAQPQMGAQATPPEVPGAQGTTNQLVDLDITEQLPSIINAIGDHPIQPATNSQNIAPGSGLGPDLGTKSLQTAATVAKDTAGLQNPQLGVTGVGLGPALGLPTVGTTSSTTLLASKFGGGVGDFAPVSTPLSLDFAVTAETKAKIWSNEFIEFWDLLHPTRASQMKLVVQQDATGGSSLGFIQGAKKQLKNIDEWVSAFAIFSCVYTAKYPAEVGKLLKYTENVRMIAAQQGNFGFYDSNFRKLRQTVPIAWDTFHTELYLKSMQMPFQSVSLQGKGGSATRPGNQQRFPNGYCYRFHGGDPCDGSCGYKHKCFRCQGGHPHFRCWQNTHRQAPAENRQEPADNRQAGRGAHTQNDQGSYRFGGPPRGGHTSQQSRGRGGGRGQGRYHQRNYNAY